MKYLQVGILVALILVAGLLALNLMQDRNPPEAAFQPIPATSADAFAVPTEDHPEESLVAEPKAAAPGDSASKIPSPKPEVAPSTGQVSVAKTQTTAAPSKRPAPSQQQVAGMTPPPAPSVPHPTHSPTREAVPVAPPASTTESWGAPAEPPSAAQDREHYELMRPERKDPAPRQNMAAASSVPEPPRSVTLPSGTILTVRTTRALSSESSAIDDTFTGTLDQPIIHEDLVIAERGSKVEGRVVQVVESGRVKGLAALSIQLTSISTSDGQTVPVQTQSFTMEAEKSGKGDAAKVGIATGIGAALGAIFGGGKGAAIGAAAGAGAGTGSVLTTKGKPAEIPSETRISFRLEQPLTLTEKINP